MKSNEMLNKIPAEAYSVIQSHLLFWGDLPWKEEYPEYDITMITHDYIKDDGGVKLGLSLVKEYIFILEKVKKIDKNALEFEDICYFCSVQFSEIMWHWFGFRKYNESKVYIIDMILMTFWDYIDNEINFDEMKEELIKLNNQYIA